MAQYDLLLTQNTHASGVEFSEKYVNLAKGSLLSALTDGTPAVLAGGTNTYKLVRDDAEVTGLKWVPDTAIVTDAFIYKGTIGTAGTHTIAAFNALTTYSVGWTYRVIEAGTIRGNVCQVGDIVSVIVARSGSGNLDSDFTVMQNNIDGAVIGPASVTDNYPALFDGTTGKLIKAGSGALGSAAYAATTAFLATWVSVPAAKNSTGTAGTVARDANWFYICTATDTWKRSPIATNW